MIRIYLKQAWSLLKENPLISGLSIAGTALAIAAVMLIFLVAQVRTAGYAPETNRGRVLQVRATGVAQKNNKGNRNNGYMGKRVVRELFYSLKTPQEVTGFAKKSVSVNTASKRTFTKYTAIYTDDCFWKIYDYTFIEGRPFTYEESESGVRKAVISEKLAKRLFERSTDLKGQRLIINKKEYVVCGVVKDVSRAARTAYADVWLPYNSSASMETPPNVNEGLTGGFIVAILARSNNDFPAIRAEVKKATQLFNTSTSENEIDFFYGPMSNFEFIVADYNEFANEIPYRNWFLTQGGFALFLLLLPALNMIGITLTSFRKRRAEIGVRKAFGASTGDVFRQVVNENLVITFIGGVLGLVLSIVILGFARDIFFASGTELSWAMLVRPGMFLVTLLFIFLLNLMCAGIPAWKAGKYNIVKSLNNQE